MAAHVTNGMGEWARFLGQFERAVALYEEADSMADETGQKLLRLGIKLNLGFVNWRLGNQSEFTQHFIEGLKLCLREGHLQFLAHSLLGMAAVAAAQGETREAAKILGTIEDHTQEIAIDPNDGHDHQRLLTSVKAQLTDKQFEQFYEEGKTISLADAAEFILRQGTKAKRKDDERLNRLTKREIEILRLVAQGLSDAQVAERLVLSPRTVNAHLTSVYRKIDVNSRAAATRFAIEHGLA
jgi:DNA-binding CsgD family transcriptional regulator